MPSRIFAFVGEGFYFNNGRGEWKSYHLPLKLSESIRASDGVTALFGGPDEQYLLQTRGQRWNVGVPRGFVMADVIPQGFDVGDIKYIAWGSGGVSWTKLGSGRFLSRKSPDSLNDKLRGDNNVRVTYGLDGRWALVRGNGGWSASGGCPPHMIAFIKQKSVGVKNIVLCPWNERYYWVEMSDGTVNYCLPQSWVTPIQSIL